MKSFAEATATVALAALLHGCTSAPATLEDGVAYGVARCGVRDAHVRHVSEHPELRVDDALSERLDHALVTDDFDDARRTAITFIDRAHALALESVHNELDRLDDATLVEMCELYFDGVPHTREEICATFKDRTDRRAAALHDDVHAAASPAALRALLAPIHEQLETPVRRQGRFGRMAPWLLFTIPSRMAIDNIYADEFRGNSDVPFAAATVHRMEASSSLATPEAELLARYAPIIVQEATPRDATYDPSIDRVGTVAAVGVDEIEVATDVASVYAYAREICLNRRPHRQLVYTHWYPAHPELEPDDPEAGPIEGVTLRITLDANDRPAILETLYNCGCSHRLYPATWLESAAARIHGAPEPGKTLSLERSVEDRKDLILPNAVEIPPASADLRPVLRVRAGWHGIVDVGFAVDKHVGESHASRGYTLRAYDELEHLVTPDGSVTSMFYDNGLVRHAERPEGVFFTPAGILSAGQPRQRGTQLIHWDDWDFDDPHLFTEALRLPPEL